MRFLGLEHHDGAAPVPDGPGRPRQSPTVGIGDITPGILAFGGSIGGAYLGAQLSARATKSTELRALMGECSDVLERADQQRSRAYALFVTDGAKTSPQGHEAISDFRQELALMSQLRARLLVQMREGAPPPIHFYNALLALERCSTALGVAAMWPNDNPQLDLKPHHDNLTEGAQAFGEARGEFLRSAQDHVSGRRLPWRRART